MPPTFAVKKLFPQRGEQKLNAINQQTKQTYILCWISTFA